jgi:phosphatidylglycerophosphatase A
MKDRVAMLVAAWFGCGHAPAARGTWGALAAVAIACALVSFAGLPPWRLGLLALLFTPCAIWAASRAAALLGKDDPPLVVVDEVVGQWTALAGAAAWNWKSVLAGFVLFRLFDIWKPPPVRRLERLHGGLGIVADDLMAGVYAALVLRAMGWFNLY